MGYTYFAGHVAKGLGRLLSQFARGAEDAVSAVAFGTATPLEVELGDVLTFTPTVIGSVAPLTFTLSSGTLPAGTTLNESTGVVTGTTTTEQVGAFSLRATDGLSSDTVTVSFEVVAPAFAYQPEHYWPLTAATDLGAGNFDDIGTVGGHDAAVNAAFTRASTRSLAANTQTSGSNGLIIQGLPTGAPRAFELTWWASTERVVGSSVLANFVADNLQISGNGGAANSQRFIEFLSFPYDQVQIAEVSLLGGPNFFSLRVSATLITLFVNNVSVGSVNVTSFSGGAQQFNLNVVDQFAGGTVSRTLGNVAVWYRNFSTDERALLMAKGIDGDYLA